MNEPFPLFFVKASEALGRYSEIEANVQHLAKRFPAADYPRVLDMCSGVGHYALAMAKAGYAVTGVDISEEQVTYACANRNHENINYKVGSMEDPLDDAPFDIILNTYSSFGYMDSIDQDQEVLKNWCSMLRKGGVLIMELPDLERAKNTFSFPNDHLDHVSGGVREERWMDWNDQMLSVRYSLNGLSYSGKTRIYSADQLKDMVLRAGFSQAATFGDFAFGPKQKHNILVLECRK